MLKKKIQKIIQLIWTNYLKNHHSQINPMYFKIIFSKTKNFKILTEFKFKNKEHSLNKIHYVIINQ